MPPSTRPLPVILLLFAAATSHVAAAEEEKRPFDTPRFGHAIAVHEDLLWVSAPHGNQGRGEAFLFRREGENHRLLGVVTRPSRSGEFAYGDCVVLDGKTLVVGDSGAFARFTTGAGAAYLFKMPQVGQPIKEPQRVLPPKPERRAAFGDAMALYDDLVAIGESARNDGGSVTMFRRKEDKWTRELTLNASQLESDAVTPSWFGTGLAMNRTTLVVGAPNTFFGESKKGAVFVYEKNSMGHFADAPTVLSWKAREHHEFFGHDVLLNDDVIVVGAMLADVDSHEEAGAACVFVRAADGKFPSTPTTVLTAAKPRKGRGFGANMATSGRRIFVGSKSHVHVFEPTPGDDSAWTQVALLDGTEQGSGFGSWSLAATGSFLYVGEPYPTPYSEQDGQVAVFARDVKNGKVTYRRIETLQMPK